MNHESALIRQLNAFEYGEKKTVEKGTQDVAEVGIDTYRNDLVNIYVSLKSKPLLILAGPQNQGKVALLNTLATSLTGGNDLQFQNLIGHPWWASNIPDVAFYVEIQHRLNIDRLLEMIEEAWQPQNAQKVYIACLNRISPGELLLFFREIAFQLQHDEIIRLGDVHLSEPVPYPPNLFIVGTMNTDRFDFWEADLLRKATIIHCSPEIEHIAPHPFHCTNEASEQANFLDSSIRNKEDACRRLCAILGEYRTTGHKEPLLPLFHIENLFNQFQVQLPPDWLEGVLVYLANSWTGEGEGLFDFSPWRNLTLAMDFAIAQSILPYGKDSIQASDDLRIGLKNILKGLFPHSAAFVDWLAGKAHDN